ncbi:hypothetical protein Agabi119p4_5331 [Agaricus bisporus var. burnettii]|uniref:Carboxylic ester hydrolase n=1 Tax=Agaricus bisporus var. burnettii TaxID=192524 RepID=A0A8H7F1H8_AGABI|nr:hypothetical protein Agabi119p4_5331 [Agaricus bisporus var. burnettii]
MVLLRPLLNCLLAFTALTKGSPARNDKLEIQLSTGTFRGFSPAKSHIEQWFGIPFAEPPVGPLRFKAPIPIKGEPGVVKDATQFGGACPQMDAEGAGAPVSEDCLYMNVYRPSEASSHKKLPVLVWIHGGQWTTGAGSRYDPTEIVQRSVFNKKPIVFVSINYRLNTFGFLASAHQPPEDLNAGLLDQRLALEFIQDNIAAFGGDPDKVTIWGQSAGGGSVAAHFIYPSEKTLFRAGIGQSATGPFKSSPPPSVYDKPGKSFDRLLSSTGCHESTAPVDCLRDVPFETLLNISNSMIDNTLNGQLWEPTIGPEGSMAMATEQASSKVMRGDFLHLPYLGSTTLNEGTDFTESLQNLNLTGQAQNSRLDDYIRALLIDGTTLTQDVLDEIHELYKENDTSLGGPFNTGDPLFDRASAFYTDEMFLGPRRLFFQHGSDLQPMFAYHFTEFIPGNEIELGVTHATDLHLLLGFRTAPEATPPPIEHDFANEMKDIWINFVNDLNPGENWPRFDNNAEKPVMQLQRGNSTLIPDDFDMERTDFVNTVRVLNEFQK